MKQAYGTLVWFLATLFVVYSFCLNTAAAVFSESIKASLHVGGLGVSIAAGAFILGYALMQIPAGYLLDRYNARFVVSSGIFLLALGNLCSTFATNIVVYSLCNLLQGIGASFAFVAAAVLISQWFPAKKFPIIFGLTQTISCVFAAIIHYGFSRVLETYTWVDIYHALAIFGFVLLVLTLVFVKSPSNYKREVGGSLKQSVCSVFRNKQIILCSLAAAASFGVLLTYASLWYAPIQEFYKVQNLDAVVISGCIFVGIGIGTPIFGYLSNCYNTRKRVIHFTLVLGLMALLMGVYLPHYDIDTLIIIKAVSFLIGFLLSGSMLFYTIVSEISPDKTRGVALSVLNTAVFLFNTLMMFAPYLFVTMLSSNFFTNLWVLPFCVLISLLLIDFIKDSHSS